MAQAVFVEGNSVKFALDPDTNEVSVDVEMPEGGPASVKDYAVHLNTIVPITLSETRFTDLGDIDDPEEAHVVLQAAFNASGAEGRPLRLDDREYETKRTLDWVSGMILEAKGPDTRIRNSLTASEASAAGVNSVNAATFNPGSYHPIYLAKEAGLGYGNAGGTSDAYLTWHAIDAVQAGQDYFVCSTPGDAANYAPGDMFLYRDDRYYGQYNLDGDANTNQQALTMIPNVVVSADPATGIVRALYGAAASFPAGHIGRCNSPLNPDTGLVQNDIIWGNPLYGVRDVRIFGVGFASDVLYPCVYGLALNCEVHSHMEGLAPLVLNGWHRCKGTLSGKGTKKLFELAMGASCNDFDVYGEYEASHATKSHALLINENSLGNDIRIDARFKGVSGTPTLSLAYFGPSRQNRIALRGAVSGNWYAPVAMLDVNVNADGHDPAQTMPLTSENSVDFQMNCDGAGFLYDSYFSHNAAAVQGSGTDANDGKASLRDNLAAGRFDHPAVATNGPVYPGGYRNRFRGTVPRGTLNLPLTGPEDFELEIDGGVSLGNFGLGPHRYCKKVVVNGVRHPGKVNAVSTSSTSYGPDLSHEATEITFTGASFQLGTPTNTWAGRRWRIELVNGTGGSIVPTVNTAYWKLSQQAQLPATLPNVNQATNKLTGVTNNSLWGTVTMQNTAIAAGATAAFTLTNSTIDYGDLVEVTILSGAADQMAYQLATQIGGNGAVVIRVKNNSAGSLGEALVLQFAVKKAAMPRLAAGQRLIMEFEKMNTTNDVFVSTRPLIVGV